jgi:hypothetical protein
MTIIEEMEQTAEEILSLTRDLRRAYKKQREDKDVKVFIENIEETLSEKLDNMKDMVN